MLGDILSIIENKPQNYLINGDFSISQRFSTSLISGPVKYGLDRWFFAQGDSVQQVIEVDQPFKFAMEAIATATGNNHLQRIESAFIRHLVGKQVTFSILMKLVSGAVGGLPKIRVSRANAVDDFSGTTVVHADADLESDAPIDATYRVFKKSFLVTQEMADNGFLIQFGDFSGATNVIRYARAMLNEGAYVARFQLAMKNEMFEYAVCQRYYEYGTWAAGVALASGVVGGVGRVNFTTEKRAIPVVTVTGNGTPNVFRNDNNGSSQGTVISSATVKSLSARSTSALTSGTQYSFNWTADAEL